MVCFVCRYNLVGSHDPCKIEIEKPKKMRRKSCLVDMFGEKWTGVFPSWFVRVVAVSDLERISSQEPCSVGNCFVYRTMKSTSDTPKKRAKIYKKKKKKKKKKWKDWSQERSDFVWLQSRDSHWKLNWIETTGKTNYG